MGRIENIFFNLVYDENSLTELLCNLLKFKPFRDSFLRLFIREDNLSKTFRYEHFRTQVDLGGHGRPDLIIEHDQSKVFIEMKVDEHTLLTDNQPMSYLKALSAAQQPHKGMFFLVPRGYVHEKSLWQGWEAFLRDNGQPRISFAIRYWDHVLSLIETEGLRDLNPIFEEFYQFLTAWYSPVKVQFLSAEVDLMFELKSENEAYPKFGIQEIDSMLTTTVPSIMTKLCQIVDAIDEHFSQKAYKVTRSRDSGEYGLYFYDKKGACVLWFGIWYGFWEKYGKPLVYAVDVHAKDWSVHAVNSFPRYAEGRYQTMDNCLASWIDKEMFRSEDCTKKVIEVLSQTLDVLVTSEKGSF